MFQVVNNKEPVKSLTQSELMKILKMEKMYNKRELGFELNVMQRKIDSWLHFIGCDI